MLVSRLSTDNYLPCLFCVGFTKKCNNQIQKTSNTQHQYVCQNQKNTEINLKEVQKKYLKEVVNGLIPDNVGKNMEKSCQSAYLLHHDIVRKVEMLEKPKLELGNSRGFMLKVEVLEKLLGMRQLLKLNKLMEMNHQSKILFRIQTCNGDKKSCVCVGAWGKVHRKHKK